MNTPFVDIELTSEQEYALVQFIGKLQKKSFGDQTSSSATSSQPALIEWSSYLLNVATEGANVRTKKKGRTTASRIKSIRKLIKLLGHFPTDKDIKQLFGRQATKHKELIALIQGDVRRMEEHAPEAKTIEEKIFAELTKMQHQIEKSSKKSR
ncbi:hypothetical protein [Hymenobacter sp. PAMC 26628]|uniref:hypothetical protein n=1 Tax=Hymenobacter sp. PAMC 26628 TaxID=1484118 RepID=UPI00076FF688|nr:hypothetical protein [Hymenobacter sp. PAMC 26628]AMJ65957.1 hypothetical protein AXW84_11330 [Hymenobacter sp. PAMC 26628]